MERKQDRREKTEKEQTKNEKKRFTPRVNKMSEGEVRTWVLCMRFSAMSEDGKRRIAENTASNIC
jgi:hypothetical protein